MSESHAVVVGGGVVGVATAYYLARQGWQVTLLEQNEIGSGCSQGNAGQVTPGHLPLPQPGVLARNLRWLLKPTSPLFVAPRWDLGLFRWLLRFQQASNNAHLRSATRMLCRLGAASRRLFEELSPAIGCDYRSPGRLEICRSRHGLAAACAEADLLDEFGFSSRRLDGAAVAEMEPAIEAEVAGGVFYPDSGYCNPAEFVRRLADAAVAEGVRLRTGSEVTELAIDNGQVRRVVARGEPMGADAVVLAGGSWTPRLARQIGLRLPIQPGKGYHLDMTLPRRRPAIPLVLVEEKIFVTPLDDLVRLAGTMEFSGFNLKLRPARLAQLQRGAQHYFPGLHCGNVRSEWCHLRPMTPDGLPVIGRISGADNVWIAAGHGMLGLTQGPITGKLVAEWIASGQPSIDLGPLRPDRF